MIPELRFVSDLGRPGVCATAYCGHGEFEHLADGPCRTCGREERENRRSPRRVCMRYDPPLYFSEPDDG